MQDIELAAISQRVSERLYNLLAIGEGGCSLQVRLRQARICSIFICRCFGTSSSRDSALRCWLPGPKTGLGHVFACPLGISLGMGGAFFRAFVPAAKALSGAYEEGIAGMLTIIKASLLASALMLLESCTGYLTSYQTPCVEGHVCECVQYTTIYRSWLDCRDYGRVKSRAY